MAVHEDYDYQILRLSDKFYQNYPNPPFAERGCKFFCVYGSNKATLT